MIEALITVAALLMTGIEAAYVPTDEGGGDYLVRVEPDLVRDASPYTFTSDVPADSRHVRRVKIYVADAWPPAVERAVLDAAKRPRIMPAVATAPVATVDPEGVIDGRPWPLLVGSLIALFLSLGANGYLGMLLANMRVRYLRDIQTGIG
jgi:hypothetical protein